MVSDERTSPDARGVLNQAFDWYVQGASGQRPVDIFGDGFVFDSGLGEEGLHDWAWHIDQRPAMTDVVRLEELTGEEWSAIVFECTDTITGNRTREAWVGHHPGGKITRIRSVVGRCQPR